MKNKVIIKGDITEIHIESKKHGHFITLVDTEDLPRIAKCYSVGIAKDNKMEGYCKALINCNNTQTLLQCFLVGKAINNMVVDHVNRNPLDNTKGNLRIITKGDNARNRSIPCNNKSGVSGVYWCKHKKKWRARIGWKKQRVHIGYFNSIEDAFKAIEHYKESH